MEGQAETAQLLSAESGRGEERGGAGGGPAPGPDGGLRRALSWVDTLVLVISCIVGSGIFVTPGVVMSSSGSVALGFLSWAIAGALATCSSLVYCELGSSMPSAGGDYTYLQRAFGDQVAYSWVFMSFMIQRPASMAIVGVIAAHYLNAILTGEGTVSVTGETPTGIRLLATLYVAALTTINVLPITFIARFQRLMALSKPLLVVSLAGLGAAHATRHPHILSNNWTEPWGSTAGGDLTRLGPSIFAALFSFNGWSTSAAMAEEMKRPQDLPRSIIGGMACVLLIYLSCNLAYLAVLPAFPAVTGSGSGGVAETALEAVPSLAETPLAALETISRASAGLLPVPVTALLPSIVISLLFVSFAGTTNVTVMTGGRVLFKVANDGQAPKAFGRLSRWRTPHVRCTCHNRRYLPPDAVLLLRTGCSVRAGGVVASAAVGAWSEPARALELRWRRDVGLLLRHCS